MKATLEFDLPAEASEHRTAVAAADLLCVVTGLDDWLRSALKYGLSEEDKGLDLKTLEAVRARLREVVRDNDVEGVLWG